MLVLKERYLTDAEGNPVAVVLDLDTYRQLLDALEDADATRAYDAAKAALPDDELVPIAQATAELEAHWATIDQQAD